MKKNIINYLIFINSCICFGQSNDLVFGYHLDWLTKKETIVFDTNNLFYPEYFYNKKNELIGTRVYSDNGILILDARLRDYKKSFKKKGCNEKQENNYQTGFKFYVKARTFYSNKQLRSDYIARIRKSVCVCFSKEGEKLFENKIKLITHDTVCGIFLLDSYYSWLKFGLYEKGERILTFTVPVKAFLNNAINVNFNESKSCECSEKFCVNEIKKNLTQSHILSLYKTINAAIDNELITSLDACFYFW